MISKTENANWIKDNGCLVNTNKVEYEQMLNKRKNSMRQQQEIVDLKEQINNLKELILSIKG
jgi:hypothetical protein